jgi:hypothetical protein
MCMLKRRTIVPAVLCFQLSPRAWLTRSGPSTPADAHTLTLARMELHAWTECMCATHSCLSLPKLKLSMCVSTSVTTALWWCTLLQLRGCLAEHAGRVYVGYACLSGWTMSCRTPSSCGWQHRWGRPPQQQLTCCCGGLPSKCSWLQRWRSSMRCAGSAPSPLLLCGPSMTSWLPRCKLAGMQCRVQPLLLTGMPHARRYLHIAASWRQPLLH